MKYIDFHTHIFPDKIAKQAIGLLAKESGEYQPKSDGTLDSLLASMDRAGISASVAANIATRPTQLLPIFEFCKQIRSERVYPLISFHPENETGEIQEIFFKAKAVGIRGVKLHPMYQEFFIDEERMYPFYELVESFGFFLMFHTGFDIAFPDNTQADVERVKVVADRYSNLEIIATHVGGWRQWDRAGVLAECGNVYTEVSMTLTEMDDEHFIKLITRFDQDRVLFGTDSPWTDQKEMLDRTLKLKVPDEFKEKLLFANAAQLLDLK